MPRPSRVVPHQKDWVGVESCLWTNWAVASARKTNKFSGCRLDRIPYRSRECGRKKVHLRRGGAASGTGFGKALPLLQPIVSLVTAGNSWANVLRRYLIGESIRICVAVGSDAGVFLYPPGSDISDEVVRRQLENFTFDDDQGRIVPKSEFLGSPESIAEDDVEIKTRKSGEANRVFENGETVRKVVLRAKAIDAARGNLEPTAFR